MLFAILFKKFETLIMMIMIVMMMMHDDDDDDNDDDDSDDDINNENYNVGDVSRPLQLFLSTSVSFCS